MLAEGTPNTPDVTPVGPAHVPNAPPPMAHRPSDQPSQSSESIAEQLRRQQTADQGEGRDCLLALSGPTTRSDCLSSDAA